MLLPRSPNRESNREVFFVHRKLLLVLKYWKRRSVLVGRPTL